MLSSHHPRGPQGFSDNTLRRFLFAQLSLSEQEEFEAALFAHPQLEQRARLAEIALIDDYVLNRLKANDRDVFQNEFLVTTARRKTLEVSNALKQTFAAENGIHHATSSSAQRLFVWPAIAWRIAFAIVALMVLFASALVIRREPQIVKRIIPKRLRPAVVATPTPVAAHHPTNSAESPEHRDEIPQLPAHEALPQTIVLLANSSPDNAPIVNLANNPSDAVRLELMLGRIESATFSVIVTTTSGEIVHDVPQIRVDARDRIDFDVQRERLKTGGFQVMLTRLTGEQGMPVTYYFRVQ